MRNQVHPNYDTELGSMRHQYQPPSLFHTQPMPTSNSITKQPSATKKEPWKKVGGGIPEDTQDPNKLQKVVNKYIRKRRASNIKRIVKLVWNSVIGDLWDICMVVVLLYHVWLAVPHWPSYALAGCTGGGLVIAIIKMVKECMAIKKDFRDIAETRQNLQIKNNESDLKKAIKKDEQNELTREGPGGAALEFLSLVLLEILMPAYVMLVNQDVTQLCNNQDALDNVDDVLNYIKLAVQIKAGLFLWRLIAVPLLSFLAQFFVISCGCERGNCCDCGNCWNAFLLWLHNKFCRCMVVICCVLCIDIDCCYQCEAGDVRCDLYICNCSLGCGRCKGFKCRNPCAGCCSSCATCCTVCCRSCIEAFIAVLRAVAFFLMIGNLACSNDIPVISSWLPASWCSAYGFVPDRCSTATTTLATRTARYIAFRDL